MTAGGLLLGTAAAVGLSEMRVKVLTGVFDPPPDALAVPWSYLTAVVGLTAVAVAAAGAGALRALNRPAILTSGGSSPRVPVGTLTAGVLRPPRPSYVQGNRSSHSSAP